MVEERTAEELEAFWAGDFGDAWMERNHAAARARSWFWSDVAAWLEPESVLEVGCGTGGNLACLASHTNRLTGVDINQRALQLARAEVSEASIVASSARSMPFPDHTFDTVISMGLLIHQTAQSVTQVMDEIDRVCSRHVLLLEYHADEPTDIEYRGNPGVLIKRNFGGIFDERFRYEHVRSEEINGPGFDRVQLEWFRR